MKFVDIYRYDGTTLIPAVIGCIQTGDVQIQRTPVTKRFVMADGSPCTYAATNDAAATTVLLECTLAQVQQLSAVIRFGVLVMAGLRLPGTTKAGAAHTLLRQTSGYTVHITGSVQITEAGAGIYAVSIPVQIELASGLFSAADVPCICLPVGSGDCLFLDGTAETLNDTQYRAIPGGILERRAAYVTSADTLTVRSYLQSIGGGTPAMQVLRGNTSLGSAEGTDCTVSAALQQRENILTLRMYSATATNLYKPQILRIPVYRQG